MALTKIFETTLHSKSNCAQYVLLSTQKCSMSQYVGQFSPNSEDDFSVQGVPCSPRLGFVDLDFECSTVCPTLLGLMGIGKKRLGS